MTEADDLVTAAQAADLLGIHRNNVLKAMREGWLPARQYGKVWLAKRADVEHYGQRPKLKAKKGVDNAAQ